MWFRKTRRWDLETDVLVVGTGGAGLTAALSAHDAGARVSLLEKASAVGGTTAVSGGVLWVPRNHHMAAAGIADSRAEALAYIMRLSDGRSDTRLIERYLDTAPEVVAYLEERTPVRFAALARYPDYHPELFGGKPGGRSLDPGLFDTNTLGPWQDKLRRSPIFGATAMSITEATDWGVFARPLSLPFSLLAERLKKGLVCYGAALVGGLLRGLLDRGVEPRLGVAARELVGDDGRVVGLRAEVDGQPLLVGARRGVVLASGGFEWNRELGAQFLGGQLTHPNSPPGNDGDGLKMAMGAGADLGNMSEAWWCPSVVIPGEEYDGRPLHRGDFSIRSLPHTIIVNRAGQRFVNEAQNYNDLMKPFFTFDPVRYERPNLPAWLIIDKRFLDKYSLVTYVPGMPVPEWLVRAESLAELAQKIEVDGAGLAATVVRFNQLAGSGVDEDFARGASLYDAFYGDPENRPNPNLGPIEQAPFYALQVHPGAIGTKGGAKVDERARVLHVDGHAIEGLYAAGNVMAGITGPGYPGAGTTIGTAMTFGYIAGRDAATRAL
jgi:succinate dehydrogenase/fumarate reductase flavoprotein subunit